MKTIFPAAGPTLFTASTTTEEYCEWEYANGDEDNASGYDAACGFTWGALDDTLIHDMIFCPHCGKRIRRDADDTVGV